MKRFRNLWEKLVSYENLELADQLAQRGKKDQAGVIEHNRDQEANLYTIQQSLIDGTYTTGPYRVFIVKDQKERKISALSYKHRIVHYAILNVIEPILVSNLTTDTYSCIKGRGIGAFDSKLKQALRDQPGTRYYLKMDVRKFYESIDHGILKGQLRRKIKDVNLLWLLDNIIDSSPGVPIGNHISSFLANFNLSPLDHFIKERFRVKHYFRYCDDMILLAADKQSLHALRISIQQFLAERLHLSLKSNYRVAPVSTGLDVAGYVYRHGYVLMRKSIKQAFARAVSKGKNKKFIAPYYGWACHCNSSHLLNKLLGKAA